MTPAAPCLLCGSTDTHYLRSRVREQLDFEYRFHRCAACTAQFVWPIPDEPALASVYGAEYYQQDHASLSPIERNSHRERLALMAELLGRRGTVLDVGAGPGLFLQSAIADGWRATGVEISRFSVEQARTIGLDVYEGFFETVDLGARRFDAIHAWAVFEHFRDPARFAARARELLEPGGLLVVHTINAGSLNARYYGPDWEYFQDLGHLSFPTERSLRQLFGREGFTVEARRSGGNPVGINRLAASDNTRGIKSPLLKRAITRVRDRVLGDPRLRRAAKTILQRLSLGDAFTFYFKAPGRA
jgi:2-polyprenyl-3-methyl-5-hydroxy-6-metoxy-1,4-benzoquinol methylase